MSEQFSTGDGKTMGKRRRPEQPSIVALSKRLAWLLRHHLDTSGLEVRNDGYVRVDELLTLPEFRQYSLPQIHEVVQENDKKRFTITTLETPSGPAEFIRATQGHSLKQIQLEMEEITSATDYPTIIHGTNRTAWNHILNDQRGLNRMTRNHIHFATGLLGEEGVISGMREACSVLIYVDLGRALGDGIKFFKSENGVVLTEGENGEGYLGKKYFEKVVTRKGKMLWPLKGKMPLTER